MGTQAMAPSELVGELKRCRAFVEEHKAQAITGLREEIADLKKQIAAKEAELKDLGGFKVGRIPRKRGSRPADTSQSGELTAVRERLKAANGGANPLNRSLDRLAVEHPEIAADVVRYRELTA